MEWDVSRRKNVNKAHNRKRKGQQGHDGAIALLNKILIKKCFLAGFASEKLGKHKVEKIRSQSHYRAEETDPISTG